METIPPDDLPADRRPSIRPLPDPPRVRLRDATLRDVTRLLEWDTPENRGEYNDFGMPPASRRSLREALEKGPMRNERNGMLIVERIDDASGAAIPIGSVSWHAVGYGPGVASRAWNMGVALLPEARGFGYGAEAQRLLADELFATTDANRVEASCDVTNVREQRSLERAGFVREGINRGAQFRAGAYHDLVMFARVRGDP